MGVGSRSCAGREKRTEAISDTPMNLEAQRRECKLSRTMTPGYQHSTRSTQGYALVSVAPGRRRDKPSIGASGPRPDTYFLKIARNMDSFDLSSGALSTAALGGAAVMASEGAVEAIVDGAGEGWLTDEPDDDNDGVAIVSTVFYNCFSQDVSFRRQLLWGSNQDAETIIVHCKMRSAVSLQRLVTSKS